MTIRNFKISDLDMEDMLRAWILRGKDTYGFDAREAVCQWVADNIDTLDSFIPPGYPREISDGSQYEGPLLITVQIAGISAIIFVFVVGALVFYHRNAKVIVVAQVHFVLLLIGGLLLIASAAIVHGIMPTDSVCASRQWLITTGFTVELIPLLVKLSAINRIVQSAKKNKRIKISLRQMFQTVLVVIMLVVGYLTIWTVIDPPREVKNLVLVEEDGNLVQSSVGCASDATTWAAIATGWEAILLVMATVLAFQTRNVVAQEYNDSQSLGTMIYTHFMFLILRVIVSFLESHGIFSPFWASGATSLLLSLDVIIATCIYIVPKIITAAMNPNAVGKGEAVLSVAFTSSEQPNSRAKERQKKRWKATDNISPIEGPTKSILKDLSMFSIDDDDSEDSGGGGSMLISIMNGVSEKLSRVSVDSGISDSIGGENHDEENGKYETKTVDESNSTSDSPGGRNVPKKGGATSARSKMREIESELAIFKQ